MNATYIIDASNWTYKFLSVYKVYRSINGVQVNISTIFGWLRALKNLPFNKILICLDGYPSLSKGWLPSYKGNRSKESEEEIYVSKAEMIKFLTQVGELLGKDIKVLCTPGQEADQVISSSVSLIRGVVSEEQIFNSQLNNLFHTMESDKLLKWYATDSLLNEWVPEENKLCIVGTTDSDMYQLQSIKDVYIDTSLSGKQINYTAETPKAVHYLAPEVIPSYKMFVGDVSDNVPKISLPKNIDILELVPIFNSDERRRYFLKSLNSSVCPFKGKLAPLWNHIKQTHQERQLLINYKVTHLEYYSTPFELSYKNYRIEDTVRKYKLKV
nr:MAG TPA: 5'-3' exonuclease [Bacteriophage sp.]